MNLTSRSATELLSLLRAGDVSAANVVMAHIRAIEQRDSEINAVAVRRFDRALDEAAVIDKLRVRRHPLGPLAGLPLTVKECFDLVGTPTTAGVARLRRQPSAGDAAVVAALRNAGAVVIGKTNLAQLCWSLETSNPVYGRTDNPWDGTRTPGGSSGGEGAAVSAHLSPVGIGTDSGGSVRIPAHYCGVHALKPTSGRLSSRGTVDELLLSFQPIVTNQPGVLSRHVEDLRLVYDLLAASPEAAVATEEAGARPGEPTPVKPGQADTGKLASKRQCAIGYFVGSLHPPSAAIQRVLLDALGELESAGLPVRLFEPPSLQRAKELFYAAFALDRGATLRALADGSDLDPLVEESVQGLGVARVPERYRTLAPLASACEEYRREFTQALDAAEIDILLCPPTSVVAHQHGMSPALEDMPITAELFNLLGMPAGVVSLSRVRREEELDRPSPTCPAEEVAARVDRGSAGLPVSVQVVGRHWDEAGVLDVMQLLENRFRGKADYPIRSAPAQR
jgi:fatty acid amide hydrolase